MAPFPHLANPLLDMAQINSFMLKYEDDIAKCVVFLLSWGNLHFNKGITLKYPKESLMVENLV